MPFSTADASAVTTPDRQGRLRASMMHAFGVFAPVPRLDSWHMGPTVGAVARPWRGDQAMPRRESRSPTCARGCPSNRAFGEPRDLLGDARVSGLRRSWLSVPGAGRR